MENKENPKRKIIIEGLKLTYKKLIKHKIDRNFELIVYENNQIKHLDPKEYIPN